MKREGAWREREREVGIETGRKRGMEGGEKRLS